MFMLHYPTSPSRSMRLLTALGLAFATLSSSAQLVLQQTYSPLNLVGISLLDPEVEFSHVTFNGADGLMFAPEAQAYGEIGRFNGSQTSLGLTSGVFLCTNDASIHLPGPNTHLMESCGGLPFATTPDTDLSQLSGIPNWGSTSNIYSKSVLEFNFVAHNDMVEFRYVFSSEEYERWACSQFNDGFGMFISGPGISGPFTNGAMNMAFIPGSLSVVTINAVNSGIMDSNNANGPWTDPFQYCAADPNWADNAAYYRYNGGQWPYPQPIPGAPQLEAPYNNDPHYLQHNGMTAVLTASAALRVGETYHMKMAVGNVSDWRYGSAVYLESNSFRCADRFSMTVDEGPNVDLSGLAPVLHESHTDSVYLRFNRWGGFYLDEHLQLSVQGNAVAGVDFLPALPDGVHFNQLDSAAVIALALPVHADTTRELLIDLISSNGDKVMSYTLVIDKEIRDNTGLAERAAEAPILFPNPTDGTLQVVLPGNLTGTTDLHVLDLAGRVVLQHQMNGTPRTTLDVSSLPNGLYVLKTMAEGRAGAARFHVRH